MYRPIFSLELVGYFAMSIIVKYIVISLPKITCNVSYHTSVLLFLFNVVVWLMMCIHMLMFCTFVFDQCCQQISGKLRLPSVFSVGRRKRYDGGCWLLEPQLAGTLGDGADDARLRRHDNDQQQQRRHW